MRNLSDALCERSFPAIAAVAAGPAVEGAEEAHPQPVAVPEAVGRDGEAVFEAVPFHAEARLEALHSASWKRCSCALCLAAKQRREFAESLSHPHTEQRCQQTPGLHSLNDLPTCIDTIDYGNNQFFNGNARYDPFGGVNLVTKTWLVVPIASKHEDTIASAIKSAHGPNQDMSKLTIRSDDTDELTSAIARTSFSNLLTPHRPNSNKAERSILVFSDLLRVWFLRSGLAPCFRPLLSIAVAQLWNPFKVVRRLDADSCEIFRSPYQLRQADNSVPIDLNKGTMPGQLVTYVPAPVHTKASQRTGPRGVDANFCRILGSPWNNRQ